jgi:hypothetical protein
LNSVTDLSSLDHFVGMSILMIMTCKKVRAQLGRMEEHTNAGNLRQVMARHQLQLPNTPEEVSQREHDNAYIAYIEERIPFSGLTLPGNWIQLGCSVLSVRERVDVSVVC